MNASAALARSSGEVIFDSSMPTETRMGRSAAITVITVRTPNASISPKRMRISCQFAIVFVGAAAEDVEDSALRHANHRVFRR